MYTYQSPLLNAYLLPNEILEEVLSYSEERDLYNALTLNKNISKLVIQAYEGYCQRKVIQTLQSLGKEIELAPAERSPLNRRLRWLSSKNLIFPIVITVLKDEIIFEEYTKLLDFLDQDIEQLRLSAESIESIERAKLAKKALFDAIDILRHINLRAAQQVKLTLLEMKNEEQQFSGKEKASRQTLLNFFKNLGVSADRSSLSNSLFLKAIKAKLVLQLLRKYSKFISEARRSNLYQSIETRTAQIKESNYYSYNKIFLETGTRFDELDLERRKKIIDIFWKYY